jgi:YVTN family beta-propeller protein
MRSRWAAIGAAVAICVGAGGVLTTSASVGSGVRTVYVPMTPCRLMDTRPPADNVGPRATPIGAGEAYSALVRGTNGQCTIPSDAVAVELSVIAVNATASSYLTVFPSDVTKPNASNLNWVANQPPISGSVKATLSADGHVSFFNLTGTVNLVVDVAGYYADHNFDDRYYTKAQTDSLVAGAGGSVSTPCSRSATPTQLAEVRWDLGITSCPAGVDSRWVAFDGTNVWVTNSHDGTVSKINAITGSTTTVSVGLYPFGVAFDGSSIWVANRDSKTLSKINPSTNAVTTVALGSDADPYAVLFDGTNIWTNHNTYGMYKINPSTNVVSDAVLSPGINGTGFTMAFDGTNVWVPNQIGNTISRINVATGVLDQYTVGTNPYGVAFDGTNIWVTNGTSNNVMRINPANGAVVATLTGFNTPRGVTFDGTNVWVTDYGSNSLVRINPTTATVSATIAIGTTPRGMVYDGANLWVVLGDPGKVVRYTP